MERYQNNSGHWLTVLQRKGKDCLVQFDNTGYTRKANIDNVKAGKCKDPYEISLYGVGYYGEIDKSKDYWKRARQLWANMLKRCYTDDPKGYKWKGVTVDDRWHCLANFIDDLPLLDGFDRWYKNDPNDKMNLDKDTKVEGNIVYSRELCCFITEKQNKSLGAKTTVAGYRRTLLKDKGDG